MLTALVLLQLAKLALVAALVEEDGR